MTGTHYPEGFDELFDFLCKKYAIDKSQVFVEYAFRPPPTLKGGRRGYYDGLLSFRKRKGHSEFLITVYSISRNPLLTLAHEFAHLVKDLNSGEVEKELRPPDDLAEKAFDDQALNDVAEFRVRTLAKP